jgi:hypothetical protein
MASAEISFPVIEIAQGSGSLLDFPFLQPIIVFQLYQTSGVKHCFALWKEGNSTQEGALD